jgi:hypothetical protein
MDKEFINNPVAAYEKLMNDYAELQTENDRLKEEIEIRDNLSEKFRKEALSWANIANKYQKDKTKLEQTLQEIKAIAEKELSYDMVGNEHRHYKNYDIIRHLITKAESEG